MKSQSLKPRNRSGSLIRGHSKRGGKTSTAVIVLIGILVAVPFAFVAMGFLSYKAIARANAAREAEMRLLAEKERALAQEARSRAEARALEPAVVTTISDSGTGAFQPSAPASHAAPPPRQTPNTFQPVKRPVYETRVNPESGRVETIQRMVTEYVPTRPAVPLPNPFQSVQDTTIERLADELRRAVDDGKPENQDDERKLQELRTRLGLEFDQMHEAQAKSIAETEERLKALKKLHQQRLERKDDIVQRRVDELLRKVDVLQWQVPEPTLSEDRTTGVLPPGRLEPFVNPVPPAASPYTDPTSLPTPDAPRYTPGPMLQRMPVPQPPDSSSGSPVPSPFALAPPKDMRPTTPPLDPPQPVAELDPFQVGTSTLVINKLFEIVRELADARSELSIAEAKLKEMSRIRRSGLIPPAEVDTANANRAKLQRKLDLFQMEWRAYGESVTRKRDDAQKRLSIANQNLQVALKKYEQGVIPQEQVATAQAEQNQAEAYLADAQSMLDYFERTKDWMEQQAQDGETDQENPQDFDTVDTEPSSRPSNDFSNQAPKPAPTDFETDPTVDETEENNSDETATDANPPEGQQES